MTASLCRGFTSCCNCGNATKGKHNYRGVLLCSHCFSLVIMCDNRASKQSEQLLETYREALRVAVASGRLKPAPPIEVSGGQPVRPPSCKDLSKFLKGLAGVEGEQSGNSNLG